MPFPELEEFVDDCIEDYFLDLEQIKMSMRDAFAKYLSTRPHIKAIIVGTRRTDPHGVKLSHFDHTDRGWPQFMRVHPVIDWHYDEIWEFLRSLKVPYCVLYDRGFTSLGGIKDTHPNPKLRDNEGHFRPAYQLADEDMERCGRDA
jgi:FAD synthetase